MNKKYRIKFSNRSVLTLISAAMIFLILLYESHNRLLTNRFVVVNSDILLSIVSWPPCRYQPFCSGNVTMQYGNKRIHCVFTDNILTYNNANFVLFHSVSFQNFSSDYIPPKLNSSQQWILHGLESPVYLSYINDMPHNITKLFDLTSSYHPNSNYYIPYGFCYKNRNELNLLPSFGKSEFDKKNRFVAWIASNCKTLSKREIYIRKLRNYIPIDIYGNCGKTKYHVASKRVFQLLNNTYKFYLSFENSLCKEYATEKVFRILSQRINIVPVVYGGANYEAMLPSHSFIDASQFSSPKHLALHLKELGSNETAYANYFTWREHYTCESKNDVQQRQYFCQKSYEFFAGKTIKNKANISHIFGTSNKLFVASLL